jgi:hypothetical protein
MDLPRYGARTRTSRPSQSPRTQSAIAFSLCMPVLTLVCSRNHWHRHRASFSIHLVTYVHYLSFMFTVDLLADEKPHHRCSKAGGL